MTTVADKIIIGDYLVPIKTGFWSIINELVEYFAGKEHYTNFKHYVANNGLTGLANKADLKIHSQLADKPVTSQILILTK